MTLKMSAKMFTITPSLKCWVTGHLVITSRYPIYSYVTNTLFKHCLFSNDNRYECILVHNDTSVI